MLTRNAAAFLSTLPHFKNKQAVKWARQEHGQVYYPLLNKAPPSDQPHDRRAIGGGGMLESLPTFTMALLAGECRKERKYRAGGKI